MLMEATQGHDISTRDYRADCSKNDLSSKKLVSQGFTKELKVSYKTGDSWRKCHVVEEA